jgi:hypothetical protein
LTITLIIELINQNNQKLEKTLLYSFGDNLLEEIIKELHMDLKLHLAKTKTILRNIHPQFKIIVGSFAIVPSKELIDNRALIFKDFRYLQDKFRGLRPDPIENMQISQSKSQLKEVTPFESPL